MGAAPSSSRPCIPDSAGGCGSLPARHHELHGVLLDPRERSFFPLVEFRDAAHSLVRTLQIFVSVGLYLQLGIKVSIDQGAPIHVPYSRCLTNICVAATPELIHEMESGQKLTLEVVDSNILTVRTSLPLDQFAAVRGAAPAQVFENLPDDE